VLEFLADMAAMRSEDTLVNGKQAVAQDTRTTMQKLADDFNKTYKK
jgi:hypothetical protein